MGQIISIKVTESVLFYVRVCITFESDLPAEIEHNGMYNTVILVKLDIRPAKQILSKILHLPNTMQSSMALKY